MATVETLTPACEQVPDHGTVVVDTTGVTFIESTGLGAPANQIGSDRFELIPGAWVQRLLDITDVSVRFGFDRSEVGEHQPATVRFRPRSLRYGAALGGWLGLSPVPAVRGGVSRI